MKSLILAAAMAVGTHPTTVIQTTPQVVVPSTVRYQVDGSSIVNRHVIGNPYLHMEVQQRQLLAQEVIRQLVEAGVIESPRVLTLHEQHCTKCHQSESSRAAGAPQWGANLTAEEIVDSLIAVSAGTMPKGRVLNVQETNAIADSLLKSRNTGDTTWSRNSLPSGQSPLPDSSSTEVPTTPTPGDAEETTSNGSE